MAAAAQQPSSNFRTWPVILALGFRRLLPF